MDFGLGFERQARGATTRFDDPNPAPDVRRQFEKYEMQAKEIREKGMFIISSLNHFSM